MSAPFAARRMYRVSIDIEATLAAEPSDELKAWPGAVNHHRSLVRHLLARPEAIDQLLRTSAMRVLKPAAEMIAAEYRRVGESDEVLKAVIAELEPAAQDYFTEEFDQGVKAPYFEGYDATITGFRVVALDEG